MGPLVGDLGEPAPPAAVGQGEAPQVDVDPLPGPAVAAGGKAAGGLVLAVPLVGEAGDQQVRRIVPPLEEPRRPAVEPRRLAEGDLVEMAGQTPERPDDEDRRDQQDGGDSGEDPPRTPPAIVQFLNTEISAVLALPEVKEQFGKIAIEPVGGSIAETTKFFADERDKWRSVIKSANISVE